MQCGRFGLVCVLALCLAGVAQCAYVDVDFFVESQSLNAAHCYNWYAKALTEVSSIINLDLSFIATANPPNSTNYVCPNGQWECLQDIYQVCVKYVTSSNPKNPASNRTWQFDVALCSFANVIEIPDQGSCAEVREMQASYFAYLVHECSMGTGYYDIFPESFAKAQSYNVTTSCTVAVNHEIFCIYDNGWKQCKNGYEPQDLVTAVCNAYNNTNKPPACTSKLAPSALKY